MRNVINKGLEKEKHSNQKLEEEFTKMKTESEKISEIERNQSKLLDDKDKIISSLQKELKKRQGK